MKQDFWSILDQMTYFASGLFSLRAMSTNAMAIPVATGATKASRTDLAPASLSQSTTKVLVRATKVEDPAALGWGSRKSPEISKTMFHKLTASFNSIK